MFVFTGASSFSMAIRPAPVGYGEPFRVLGRYSREPKGHFFTTNKVSQASHVLFGISSQSLLSVREARTKE